jgi:hypothetical protein
VVVNAGGAVLRYGGLYGAGANDDQPKFVRKRIRRVPAWLAGMLAGEMVAGMMTEGRGFSNAKAQAELGWEPHYPSWRQGFAEELA